MYTKLLSLIALLVCLFAAAPVVADPINAVAGDQSWFAYKTGDPADGSERERIQTHLLWVEQTLRQADHSGLPADVVERRLNLLDELARYRLAAQFPKHERGGEGRQPRWVDHDGRLCAVGHLVAATGHDELFDRIAIEHEYDYVADMKVPELLDWAEHYGFTSLELGMIQPAYRNGGSVYVPSPIEEEQRRKEEERRRKIPRPLKLSEVESYVPGYIQIRELKRACLKQKTGAWKVRTVLTVNPSARASVEATVTRPDGTPSPSSVSRCFESELTDRIQEALEFVNYTVEKTMTVTTESEISVPNHDEIEADFMKRNDYNRHFGSAEAGLAKCFKKHTISPDSLVVPLSVSSWNGQVVLRWPEIPEAKDHEYRKFAWCLQDVLTYGRVSDYGIWDHNFSVQIDSDGSMKPIPAPAHNRASP